MKKLIILFALALLVSGCATTYKFSRCTAVDVCSTAEIKSRREFPDGILVEFNSETKAFKVEAGRVTEKPNPLEQIGAQVLTRLIEQYIPQVNENE
ncbi:MAG: hypothetical protein OQK29_06640 [Ignavibacteriaceae bacterium]|nr:hypothetical protein [Ignavibacteriaceae bacterium]